MKPVYFFLYFLILPLLSFSQNTVWEKVLSDGYLSRPIASATYADSLLIVSYGESMVTCSQATVVCINKNGEVKWQKVAPAIDIFIKGEAIYLLIYDRLGDDVEYTKISIAKLDSGGEVIEEFETSTNDLEIPGALINQVIGGLSVMDSGEIIFHLNNNLYSLSPTKEFSKIENNSTVKDVAATTSSYIHFTSDSIINHPDLSHSQSLNSIFVQAEKENDTIYVLTENKFYIFDSNLERLDSVVAAPASFIFDRFALSNGKIFIKAGNQFKEFSKDLDLLNEYSIVSPLTFSLFNVLTDVALITGTTQMSETALQAIDLLSDTPYPNIEDISIYDIQIDSVKTSPNDAFPPIYNTYISVFVRNEGNTVIDSIAVFSDSEGDWICDNHVFVKIKNLSLHPGEDSVVTIVTGLYISEYELYDVRVLSPNWKIDNNFENNSFSETFTVTSTISKKSKAKIDVYPNPVKDFFTIEMETGASIAVELYDPYGSIVLKEFTEAGERIDVSSLGPGVYLIKVSNGDAVTKSKIIKY